MSVRIGVVGCGAVAPTHAHAIRRIDNARLSGFFDVAPERAVEFSERFAAPAAPCLDALLEISDAISVCVPSGLHSDVAVQAVRAGKHVLVEKPIDITVEAAQRLIDEGHKAKVKVSVVSQHRFAPDVIRLKEAADGGELGRLIEGDAYVKWFRSQAYYDSGDWRGTKRLDGGGCLINQGIHYIDLIQWIMGGAQSVSGRCRTAAHEIEVEDMAAALVEYRNGATGVIQGSTSYFPGFSERLEVHGDAGSAIVEGDDLTVWEVRTEDDGSPYGRGVQMQPTPNIRLSAPKTGSMEGLSPAERWIEQHRLQIQDFVDAVADDRPPFITGEDALEPLKLILAIYESSRLSRMTEIAARHALDEL